MLVISLCKISCTPLAKSSSFKEGSQMVENRSVVLVNAKKINLKAFTLLYRYKTNGRHYSQFCDFCVEDGDGD